LSKLPREKCWKYKKFQDNTQTTLPDFLKCEIGKDDNCCIFKLEHTKIVIRWNFRDFYIDSTIYIYWNSKNYNIEVTQNFKPQHCLAINHKISSFLEISSKFLFSTFFLNMSCSSLKQKSRILELSYAQVILKY